MDVPSRYSCEEVFARLDDFLDRELTSDEMRLVQEHLDTCVVCAAEHRFESTVLQDVRHKLARIDVPPGLIVRIGRRLADAERQGDPPGT